MLSNGQEIQTRLSNEQARSREGGRLDEYNFGVKRLVPKRTGAGNENAPASRGVLD
jgi:hypothetical protein